MQATVAAGRWPKMGAVSFGMSALCIALFEEQLKTERIGIDWLTIHRWSSQ